MPRYASSSAVVGVLESTVTPELDWELLYDLYSDRLRRIVQRKVGPTLTEDVLQETFLRAFRNRRTLDPGRPIAPWLITIALRAATDAQRRQLRTVDSELVEEPCEENGFGAVEEELVRRARALGIKHALASLNTKQRRMLEAVAVDGVAYDQLAASERMSPHAVKTALARARTNFRSSYTGFTRSTDLFGGLVGAAIWRLRARLQRYQELVGEHAAAFGAATVTVAVVGLAAYPAARPLPTRAAEAERVVSSAGTAVGATTVDAALVVQGASDPSPAAPSQTTPVRPASDPAVTVATRADVSSADTMRSTTVSADAGVGEADSRNYGGVDIDCTQTVEGQVTCSVLDHLLIVIAN